MNLVVAGVAEKERPGVSQGKPRFRDWLRSLPQQTAFPVGQGQQPALVRLPEVDWPERAQVPDAYPAVNVTRVEVIVLGREGEGRDLGGVGAEDVGWGEKGARSGRQRWRG